MKKRGGMFKSHQKKKKNGKNFFLSYVGPFPSQCLLSTGNCRFMLCLSYNFHDDGQIILLQLPGFISVFLSHQHFVIPVQPKRGRNVKDNGSCSK